MPTKRVEKAGVYRHKDVSAVYLAEGAQVEESVLSALTLDQGATDKRNAEKDPAFSYGGIVDAPQSQKAEDTWSGRMVAGAPENKAMPAERKTDGELADDSAKGKK